MDWFRRLLGYSDKSQKDANPFKDPTWEEILENRSLTDSRLRTSDGLFSGSFYNEDFITHPREFEDSFSSVFGQIDDMFSQLDMMMKGMHQHQSQMIITDVPGYHVPSEHHSPRDFMLKDPDSKQSDDSKNSPERHSSDQPHSFYSGPTQPYHGPEDENYEGSDEYFDGPRNFGRFGGFTVIDPHRMVDDIFKSFGGVFGGTPFGGFTDPHALPDPGMDSSEHSRDSVIKKEDSDLDDRMTGDLSQMLKDGPKYDSPARPGSSHSQIIQPETSQLHPGVHQSYRSTSIVRIRRPDGTVEETKKYVDSSGREEVIVTHTQPDGGSNPNHPFQPGDQGGPDGPGGHPQTHYFPSFFSRIFTR